MTLFDFLDPAFLSSLLFCLWPLANVLAQCCCNSATNCDIYSNDFSSGTTTGFTINSGSWSSGAGLMFCTAAGSITCDTPHPDGDITMSVEVEFKHDTNGSSIDVKVGETDSTHYYYARYTVNSGSTGSIDIRFNNGGSHSSKALLSSVTLTAGTFYTAFVCVKPSGVISASLDGTVKISCLAQAVTGTYSGLVSNGSGNSQFDNYVMSKSYEPTNAPSCPACSEHLNEPTKCTDCCSHTGSTNFTIEWPGGFSDIDSTNCHNCSGFTSGEYVATGTPDSTFDICRFTHCTTGAFEADCTDGTTVGGGGDSPSYCKFDIEVRIYRDTATTPDECYLRVNIKLFTQVASLGQLRLLASASYQTPVGMNNSDLCSSDVFALELIDETNPYRSQTGWLATDTTGCTGSWPASLNVWRS